MFGVNKKKLFLSFYLLLPVALMANNKDQLDRSDLENTCGCGAGSLNPRPRPKPKPGQRPNRYKDLSEIKKFSLHSVLSVLFNKNEDEVKTLLDKLPEELAKELPTLQSKLEDLGLKLAPELADLLTSHGALISELIKLLMEL